MPVAAVGIASVHQQIPFVIRQAGFFVIAVWIKMGEFVLSQQYFAIFFMFCTAVVRKRCSLIPERPRQRAPLMPCRLCFRKGAIDGFLPPLVKLVGAPGKLRCVVQMIPSYISCRQPSHRSLAEAFSMCLNSQHVPPLFAYSRKPVWLAAVCLSSCFRGQT